MAGTLTLKWGTVKGWSGLDDKAMTAMQKFTDLGMSMSAAAQDMTNAHKVALCEVIDCVDEPIYNGWSGEEMTRDQAKKYIKEYRT